MKYTAILPSIWPEWSKLCVDSMAPSMRGQLVIVDNTNVNLGVAASWNLGVGHMRRNDAEWLIVVSAATRFGPPGGLDFVAHLEAASGDEWAIEAGECPRQPGIGFGWHLIAFPARTFARVGTFDENFWPAYFEDLDFGHRIRCAVPEWTPGPDPIWPKVDVDADLAGFAHGKVLAGVEVPVDPLVRYFSRKWGGLIGETMYDRPFGDPKNGLDYWPEPDRSTHV